MGLRRGIGGLTGKDQYSREPVSGFLEAQSAVIEIEMLKCACFSGLNCQSTSTAPKPRLLKLPHSSLSLISKPSAIAPGLSIRFGGDLGIEIDRRSIDGKLIRICWDSDLVRDDRDDQIVNSSAGFLGAIGLFMGEEKAMC